MGRHYSGPRQRLSDQPSAACQTQHDVESGGDEMSAILFVRITSELEREEFDRRLVERQPSFREVPGLVQKVYGRDESGAVCGIYFFDGLEALAAFRQSELARSIPSAYEATDVRREAYDVLYSLRPERGPFAGTHAAAAVD